MKVKKVLSHDLNDIFNLECEVFKENAFTKDLIKKLIKRNLFFFKLVKYKIKKEIVGFVIVIKDRADRANIINLLIKPKYHNRGYGSFLLKETLKKIREFTDIEKTVLNVQISNSNAIKLYEKFNFRKIKKIENYYKSKESAYLMEKEIEYNNN